MLVNLLTSCKIGDRQEWCLRSDGSLDLFNQTTSGYKQEVPCTPAIHSLDGALPQLTVHAVFRELARCVT